MTKEFYITDHLGNVRIVFNENAEIVKENSYYLYGLLMKQANFHIVGETPVPLNLLRVPSSFLTWRF